MDSFTGEVRVFGFNYAPQDWAFCNGSVMAVQQNPALYSIIGNRYGGDVSKQTFALPNINGQVVGGAIPGDRVKGVGKAYGSEAVVLSASQVAVHNHTLNGTVVAPLTTTSIANLTAVPGSSSWLSTCGNASTGKAEVVSTASNATTPDATLAAQTLGFTGATAVQGHENRQPYLVMNFCISLYGEYPVNPDS